MINGVVCRAAQYPCLRAACHSCDHADILLVHTLPTILWRMDFSPQSLLAIALGIGLAAATGLRIFMPLLIVALAARFGGLPLGDSFQWLASAPALVTLATAAVAEILAYLVPGIDHLLDVIASPVTVAAGIFASAGPG